MSPEKHRGDLLQAAKTPPLGITPTMNPTPMAPPTLVEVFTTPRDSGAVGFARAQTALTDRLLWVGARLMAVEGRLHMDEGVIHEVAETISDESDA